VETWRPSRGLRTADSGNSQLVSTVTSASWSAAVAESSSRFLSAQGFQLLEVDSLRAFCLKYALRKSRVTDLVICVVGDCMRMSRRGFVARRCSQGFRGSDCHVGLPVRQVVVLLHDRPLQTIAAAKRSSGIGMGKPLVLLGERFASRQRHCARHAALCRTIVFGRRVAVLLTSSVGGEVAAS